jgi:phosphoglycerate kinase
MSKQTIRNLRNLQGGRVFVRVDFNVPLESGRITDDTRIRAAIPTIAFLRDSGAQIVLASHLGRPKKGPAPEFSLRVAAERLADLLKTPLAFASDCVGPSARTRSADLQNGQILVLENVRFHKEEEANDPAFARALIETTGATSFVNDAFGTAHRAHASTAGVAPFVTQRVAGFLMEKEVHYLSLALLSPPRPYVAILGGAKVSDKITVIESLLPRVDRLLIGGGMAYTFFRAQGLEVGKSLVEADKVELAQALLRSAGGKIMLPVDHVVADRFAADANTRIAVVDATPSDFMGLDIGPRTISAFQAEIARASLVLWNGPMGVFEMKPFATGTFEVARALAAAKATKVVGGGDSVAALAETGLTSQITHVSTGGGASLEFLSGDMLPGVTCLDDVL